MDGLVGAPAVTSAKLPWLLATVVGFGFLLLVPAVMYLCGRANWWLPRWLDRRLPHLAIEPPTDEPPARVPEPARV